MSGATDRRNALRVFAAGALSAVAPAWAQSGRFPNRPIRVIVPFASGGTIDAVCRPTIEALAKELGQPMFLDAKPGANGVLGAGIVAASPPDGHTLLIVTGSFAVNPSIYRKLPYDAARDFTPITPIARSVGLILVASPSLPVENVQELVAHASRSDLNYSSPGVGNTLHLSMELFKQATGLRATHVPYKGSAAAINAVVANEVQVAFATPVGVNAFIKARRIKGLATTASAKLSDYPEVPTMAESGVKYAPLDGSWIGLFCPSATPRAVVDRLHTAVDSVLKNPVVRESISANGSGYIPDGRSPGEFAKQVSTDFARYAEAVKLAGIQPE